MPCVRQRRTHVTDNVACDDLESGHLSHDGVRCEIGRTTQKVRVEVSVTGVSINKKVWDNTGHMSHVTTQDTVYCDTCAESDNARRAE